MPALIRRLITGVGRTAYEPARLLPPVTGQHKHDCLGHPFTGGIFPRLLALLRKDFPGHRLTNSSILVHGSNFKRDKKLCFELSCTVQSINPFVKINLKKLRFLYITEIKSRSRCIGTAILSY